MSPDFAPKIESQYFLRSAMHGENHAKVDAQKYLFKI